MSENHHKSTFGDTLFGGSRFIFWCLGPLFLLVATFLVGVSYTLFAAGRFGPGGFAVAVAFICVCFFLALLNGPYFWWAGRLVAASIFGVYLWYLLDTWLIHPKPFEIGVRRSEATPWNALLGLVIIGWPSLLYTFLGRFSLRPPQSDRDVADCEAYEEEDEEDSGDQRSKNGSRNV